MERLQKSRVTFPDEVLVVIVVVLASKQERRQRPSSPMLSMFVDSCVLPFVLSLHPNQVTSVLHKWLVTLPSIRPVLH